MLWNDKQSTLPNNCFSSLAQLKSLDRRLEKDSSLREKYSKIVTGFSSTISGLVALFMSLSSNDDQKSVNVLNQAVIKLPPNLEEAWSLQTVRRQCHRPALLDFNECFKEKAEGHERLKTISSEGESEEPVKQK